MSRWDTRVESKTGRNGMYHGDCIQNRITALSKQMPFCRSQGYQSFLSDKLLESKYHYPASEQDLQGLSQELGETRCDALINEFSTFNYTFGSASHLKFGTDPDLQKKATRLLAEMVPGEPGSAARPLELIVAEITAEISPHV